MEKSVKVGELRKMLSNVDQNASVAVMHSMMDTVEPTFDRVTGFTTLRLKPDDDGELRETDEMTGQTKYIVLTSGSYF